MSKELINFNTKIAIFLSLLILNSFVILFLKLPTNLLKLNIIGFLTVFFIFCLKYYKSNFSLKLYFFLILIICIGSPAINWDLRSIYLFHAKRIFFDGSIFTVADNYATFSNNDYPPLLSTFSASFSFLLGFWNENFSKMSFVFIYLPPLIFLSSYFNNKKYLVLLSVIIFFIGQYLYNGGADGILSIYFITCAFCFYQIFIKENSEIIDTRFYLITLLFCTCLSLIKNEGLALLLIIFVTTVLCNIFQKSIHQNLKKIFTLSICFTPMLLWKYFCYKNNIENLFLNLNSLDIIFSRLYDLENYILFFDYFFISNEKFMISLAIFLISFYINFNKKLFYFSTILFISYLVVILLVHFSSPLDLKFQLHTTSFRIVKTFTLLLSFFGLYNFNLKLLK